LRGVKLVDPGQTHLPGKSIELIRRLVQKRLDFLAKFGVSLAGGLEKCHSFAGILSL
jgi:hypothetical protein